MLHAFWQQATGFRYVALALGMVISATNQLRADFEAYSDGHADIGVAYAGAGALELHWHLKDGAVVNGTPILENEFAPNEIRAVIPGHSNFSRGAGATWDFIGNSAGQTTYFLPESPTVGVPYLGFGSEELDPLEWSSTNLNWSISSFSGPGEFSIFTDLERPRLLRRLF